MGFPFLLATISHQSIPLPVTSQSLSLSLSLSSNLSAPFWSLYWPRYAFCLLCTIRLLCSSIASSYTPWEESSAHQVTLHYVSLSLPLSLSLSHFLVAYPSVGQAVDRKCYIHYWLNDHRSHSVIRLTFLASHCLFNLSLSLSLSLWFWISFADLPVSILFVTSFILPRERCMRSAVEEWLNLRSMPRVCCLALDTEWFYWFQCEFLLNLNHLTKWLSILLSSLLASRFLSCKVNQYSILNKFNSHREA